MRILELEPVPFSELVHWNAAPRSRGGGPERVKLPIHRGSVDRLPPPLAAVVVTSDLQGRDRLPDSPSAAGAPPRLLGEALCDHLCALAETGLIAPPDRTGVVLCGDLYARPESDRRGGSGDATPVWRAFASRFRWVAGVAGNHDDFGTGLDGLDELLAIPGVHYLDGNACAPDGLRIGGVGGILGDPRKLQRKAPALFLSLLEQLVAAGQDLIALHESPRGSLAAQIGSAELAELLELAPQVYSRIAADPPLIACGHCSWREPLAVLAGGIQVLNVDHRVAVLTARAVHSVT